MLIENIFIKIYNFRQIAKAKFYLQLKVTKKFKNRGF